MIDLKSHIYALISGDTTITDIVGTNIHIFSDDSDEMKDFEDRLPQITFARIPGALTDVGIRNETFQISAWADSPVDAEALSRELVRLFNRTKNTTYRNCTVQMVNDSYDRDTKAYGVHITAKFTVFDPSY